MCFVPIDFVEALSLGIAPCGPPSREENRMKTTTMEASSTRADKRSGALAPDAVMEISKDLRVLLADASLSMSRPRASTGMSQASTSATIT